MQGLVERLCWQVSIDDAGATLGLSELVHFAKSPDLANLKEQDVGPPPGPIRKTVSPRIPFRPFGSNGNNSVDYGSNALIEQGEQHKDSYRGNRTNTNDEGERDRWC